MNNKINQSLAKNALFITSLLVLLTATLSNAYATPGIMQHYGAPDCSSCHARGAYNTSEGQAGLAAFLASTNSTCTPPLVLQNNVCVSPATTTTSDSDRIFDYMEAIYPAYFSPAGAPSTTIAGFYYRYYPSTQSYIATTSDTVYYIGPASNNQIISLGTLAQWRATTASTGTSNNTGYYGGNDYEYENEGYEDHEGHEGHENHGDHGYDDD